MGNEPSDSETMTWNHTVKGLITGRVVRQDDTWVHIELVGDHKLRYASAGRRGRVDGHGSVITLRRSRLHPVASTASGSSE